MYKRTCEEKKIPSSCSAMFLSSNQRKKRKKETKKENERKGKGDRRKQ